MSNTPEVALYQDNQITIFATEQLLNKECTCLITVDGVAVDATLPPDDYQTGYGT